MGSSASSKRGNNNQVISIGKHEIKQLKKVFDTSYFSLKSPYWSSLTHSLFSGGYNPDPLSPQIYKSFRRFILDSAKQYKNSEPSGNSQFVPKNSPPPLVDELWCASLQLTEQYKSLCQNLIGTFIHRKIQDQVEGFENLCLKYWPEYDKEFWQQDKKYTVWVFYGQIDQFLKQTYEYVFYRESLRNHQKVYEIHFHLNMIRSLLQSTRNKDLAQRVFSEPSESNPFYGLNLTEKVEPIYESALSNLTKPIRELIEAKLYLGEFSVLYFEEYARFLTMVYFQPNLSTPSHELELMWRIHASETLQYSDFCQKVFNKDLDFSPTSSKQDKKVNTIKAYQKTQDLYIALFKQKPPVLVWPSIEDWSDESKSKGSWISLLRLVESIQKVFDVYKTKEVKTSVIMSAYMLWGKTLKTDKFKELIENKKIVKEECVKEYYKDEGQDPVEADWGRVRTHTGLDKGKNSEIKVKTLKGQEFEDVEEERGGEVQHVEKRGSKKFTGKEKNAGGNEIMDEGLEDEGVVEDHKGKKKSFKGDKSVEKPANEGAKGSRDQSFSGKSPKRTEKSEKKKHSVKDEDVIMHKQSIGNRKSPVKEPEGDYEKKKTHKDPEESFGKKKTHKDPEESYEKKKSRKELEESYEKKKTHKVPEENYEKKNTHKDPEESYEKKKSHKELEESYEKKKSRKELEESYEKKKTHKDPEESYEKKKSHKALEESYEKKKSSKEIIDEEDKKASEKSKEGSGQISKKSKTLKNGDEAVQSGHEDNSELFDERFKGSKTIKMANLIEIDD